MSEGTPCEGPWCERFCTIGQKFCSDHRRQLRDHGELWPIKTTESSLSEALKRVIPMPDLSGAACAGMDTASFTQPAHPKRARKVAEICAGCPVLKECRAWALATHEGGDSRTGDPWPIQGVVGGIWFKTRPDRRRVDFLQDAPEFAAA